MTEFAECLRLDLANPLSRDVELGAGREEHLLFRWDHRVVLDHRAVARGSDDDVGLGAEALRRRRIARRTVKRLFDVALADVLHTSDATIGTDQTPPGGLRFNTQDEKDKAIAKGYADLATKFSGSGEGSMAAMALGSDAVAKGNWAEAEKQYKAVVDNGPKAYASLARMALAQVFQSQGKNAEAQKVLQDAVNNPSETVSKDQATIALARVMASSNKTEALKMLDKLRSSPRVPVSGAAGQAYTEIETAGKQ